MRFTTKLYLTQFMRILNFITICVLMLSWAIRASAVAVLEVAMFNRFYPSYHDTHK